MTPMKGSDNRTYSSPARAIVAAALLNDNLVVGAPGAGRKLSVLAWMLSGDVAVNAKWRSAAADRTGLQYLAAKGGAVAPMLAPDGSVPWFECAENEALNLHLSAAQPVGGIVVYTVEPA